jgi:hypothetical protein
MYLCSTTILDVPRFSGLSPTVSKVWRREFGKAYDDVLLHRTVRQSHREWREILVFMGKPKGGTLWVLAMNSGFPPFPVDFV